MPPSPDERFFEEVGKDGLTQHQRECLKDLRDFEVEHKMSELRARSELASLRKKPFLTAQDILFLRDMKVGL